MGKPAWLKRALAAYAAILFAGDTISDLKVGVGLYDRCHYLYSFSVLFFAGLPGLLTGGIGMIRFLKFLEKKCGCDDGTCGLVPKSRKDRGCLSQNSFMETHFLAIWAASGRNGKNE